METLVGWNWGNRTVKNISGVKLGKLENPEKNPKNPDIANRNWPPGDTLARTREPITDRQEF